MTWILRLFAIALIIVGGVGSSQARIAYYGGELIRDFTSMVTVNPDSSLEVMEKITVIATGDQIKHGIYRDFPLITRDEHGKARGVGFYVLDVQRDNVAVSYSTKDHGSYVRVYMGTKSDWLVPGEHTFLLSYRTTRQIRSASGYDEIYWNVTGNEWAFPIESVTAIIALPPGAAAMRSYGYTGGLGARGQNYTQRQPDASTVVFTSQGPFALGEGMTVAVDFPQGFLHGPSLPSRIIDYIHDHSFIAFVLAYLLVYLLLGLWVRRQRRSLGVIVPQFVPPSNLSPAMANYVLTEFEDDLGVKAFTATIVNMAVKGYLTIMEKGGRYCLVRKRASTSELAEEEQKIANKFFRIDNELLIGKESDNLVSDAFGAMRADITLYSKDTYYKSSTNILMLICMVGLNIFALWYLMKQDTGADAMFYIVVLINVAFWHKFFQDQPTAVGSKLLKQLEGFKMYLAAAERDRLNMTGKQPEMSPILFEKYLPFAIALGVENAWGERFASFIQASNMATYTPTWCCGDRPFIAHIGHMSDSFVNNFAASIGESLTTVGGDFGGSSFGGGFGGSGGGGSGGGGGGGGGGGF